ncbi:MAG TPA: hypothetical protein PLO89_11670, partial [Spirochaetota bacterium]|nr:hypothetical protein [Spirochaetota bacterium]
MKKIVVFFLLILFCISLFSQKKNSSIQFNGSYETVTGFYQTKVFSVSEPKKIESNFNWGMSNLLNLRFKANVGEYLTFGFAVNFKMIAGSETDIYKLNYTLQAFSSGLSYIFAPNSTGGGIVSSDGGLLKDSYFSIPFYTESTYIGSFTFERVYFKAGNDYFDIETGLIRLARGYGYMFSPTDLFNPRNPTDAQARPAGKLAVVATFYPADMWNIELFSIFPDNPISKKGWGFKFGAATKFSVKKLNFEFLYSLFMPEVEYEKKNKNPITGEDIDIIDNDFTQIAGFSMKADIEIGLFIDAIYKFEHKSFKSVKYYGKDF